ncbi:MAG: hypothetical protein U0353_08675 [Sandaracinus sp.]
MSHSKRSKGSAARTSLDDARPLLAIGEYPLLAVVGRESELAALDDWLAHGSRPLLIVGQGGSGKSALAARWALGEPARRARVVWHSLYATSGLLGDLVETAFAELVREPRHDTRLDDVIERLVAARAIVVVDGLERALEDDGSFHDALALATLRALVAAGLPLLLTSRVVPRELADELVRLDVEQMTSPALFTAHAAVGPRTAEALHALADHHALTAKLLAGLLADEPSFDVAGEAASRRAAILEAAFAVLPARTQTTLARLGALSRPLEVAHVLPLVELADEDAGDPVLAEAELATLAQRGFVLYARGRTVDLHPLIRGFLEARRSSSVAAEVLDLLVQRSLQDPSLRVRAVGDLALELERFRLACDAGRLGTANALLRELAQLLTGMGIATAERRDMLARLLRADPLPSNDALPALQAAGLSIDAISARANELSQVSRLLGDTARGESIARWALELDLRVGSTPYNLAVALSTCSLATRSYREKVALLELAESALAVGARIDAYFVAQHAWYLGELGDARYGEVRGRALALPQSKSSEHLLLCGEYHRRIGAEEDTTSIDADFARFVAASPGQRLYALNLANFRAESAFVAGDVRAAERFAHEAYALAGRAGLSLDRRAHLLAASRAACGDRESARVLIERHPPQSAWAALWTSHALSALDRPSEAIVHARRAWAELACEGEAWTPGVARRALALRWSRAGLASPEPTASVPRSSEPTTFEPPASVPWFHAPVSQMLGALSRAKEHAARAARAIVPLPLGWQDDGSVRTRHGHVLRRVVIGDDDERVPSEGEAWVLGSESEPCEGSEPRRADAPRIVSLEADLGWVDRDVTIPRCELFAIDLGSAEVIEELAAWASERVEARAVSLAIMLLDGPDEPEAAHADCLASVASLVQSAGATELALAVYGTSALRFAASLVERCERLTHVSIELSGPSPEDDEAYALARLVPRLPALSLELTGPLRVSVQDALRVAGAARVVS